MAAILADDILKWIFLNENGKISIQISLKYVPKSSIDNKPALVQVMAWCRTGDKPLSEPTMTQFTDAYIFIQFSLKSVHKDSLVRIDSNNGSVAPMINKPLSEPLGRRSSFWIESRCMWSYQIYMHEFKRKLCFNLYGMLQNYKTP